jgi:hypothetical protein
MRSGVWSTFILLTPPIADDAPEHRLQPVPAFPMQFIHPFRRLADATRSFRLSSSQNRFLTFDLKIALFVNHLMLAPAAYSSPRDARSQQLHRTSCGLYNQGLYFTLKLDGGQL